MPAKIEATTEYLYEYFSLTSAAYAHTQSVANRDLLLFTQWARRDSFDADVTVTYDGDAPTTSYGPFRYGASNGGQNVLLSVFEDASAGTGFVSMVYNGAVRNTIGVALEVSGAVTSNIIGRTTQGTAAFNTSTNIASTAMTTDNNSLLLHYATSFDNVDTLLPWTTDIVSVHTYGISATGSNVASLYALATTAIATSGTRAITSNWSGTGDRSFGITAEVLSADTIVAIDATATQTVPAATMAVTTADVVLNASVAQTLFVPTQSVTGSQSITIGASVVQTLEALTNVASGSTNNPTVVSQTLPLIEQAISGIETFLGSVSQDLPNISQSSTATEVFDGVITNTIGLITQTINASAGASATATGIAAATLPNVTQTGTAIATIPATITQQLSPVTQLLLASKEEAVSASLVQTIPNLTQYAYVYVSGSPTYEPLGVGSEITDDSVYAHDFGVGKRRVTKVKRRFGVG